jgi:anti-anti-sigma factor
MRGALALIELAEEEEPRFIRVRGELDVANTAALRDWLARASEGGTRSLVVDLRDVTFLAVSALYVLCDEQHRMAQHEARLTLVSADRRLLQLFAVCRLDGVLEVVAAPDQAGPRPWEADDRDRAELLADWLRRYGAAQSA